MTRALGLGVLTSQHKYITCEQTAFFRDFFECEGIDDVDNDIGLSI